MSEMPDIHSPEFRSLMFNHFLRIQQEAQAAKQGCELIEGLTFDELTPEKWAAVNSHVEAIRSTADYALMAVGHLDMFVDDKETMDKIAAQAHAKHLKENP